MNLTPQPLYPREHLYLLNRRLDESQSQFGRFAEVCQPQPADLSSHRLRHANHIHINFEGEQERETDVLMRNCGHTNLLPLLFQIQRQKLHKKCPNPFLVTRRHSHKTPEHMKLKQDYLSLCNTKIRHCDHKNVTYLPPVRSVPFTSLQISPKTQTINSPTIYSELEATNLQENLAKLSHRLTVIVSPFRHIIKAINQLPNNTKTLLNNE